jgi:protein PsiE
MSKSARALSMHFLEIVEHIGLLVIAIATVLAMASEVVTMIRNAQVTLSDLLLLFIYLEVFSMVGQYTARANCRCATRFILVWWRWRGI